MTALPLVAALAWTTALIADREPFGSAGALLAGVGLIVISTVAVVGMTVTGGRWSRRLALVSVVAGLTLAVMRPIDGFWFVATAASVVAGSALFAPSLTARIRRLPAAAGPPQSAVLLTTVLLAVPFPLGVAAGRSDAWAVLLVGLTAPLFAYLFARVVPGGLLGVRIVWPLLALSLVPALALTTGLLSAVAALAVGSLAWRSEVKASFHPPRQTGTSYPIPPELTPEDVLDAAQLDDRGRPK